MRRLFAVCLIGALWMLPAIDFVYCPDGCADANRSGCAWQTDVASAAGSCGLCINAVAVRCAVILVEPVQRLRSIGTSAASDLVSIPPRAIDRPPRRS